MELTFITIHDITPECIILYASDSIVDVLGYSPADVAEHSTFDYFHEEDLPLARNRYKNELEMNHASSLAYARVRNKAGEWLICECVFSFVYDVLVAATTLYQQGPKSNGRAIAAPIVREAFNASRREAARYEMMTHLSAKFTSLVPVKGNEVRAAFILNRFTKSLTILYATHALHQLVGLDPSAAVGYSFFDCIDPDCIEGAVDAIDRAKQNDSVAYMRFRWKDPTRLMNPREDYHDGSPDSAASGDAERNNARADVDIESVVSCTSDGILVVLRRAATNDTALPARGLFAVPWSEVPLYPAPPHPCTATSTHEGANGTGELDNTILNSIQEISAFIWSLQANPEIMQTFVHGRATLSGPPTPALTNPASSSSEGSPALRNGATMPNAIEIDSD